MKLNVLVLLVVTIALYNENAVAQEQKSKFKLNSFDADFGFYNTINFYQTNVIKDNDFNFRSESIRGSAFKPNGSQGSGATVFNASLNLAPFSKKKDGYKDGQTLRLTAGYVSSSYIGIQTTYERKSFRYDTLLVETTSTQNGQIETDTIPRDSVITNSSNTSIESQVIKIGAQYLFSISTGLITLSAGPGIDFNLGVASVYEEYRSSNTSIDDVGDFYVSNNLQEYYANDIQSSKISPTASIVPNASLYLVKAAKKRNSWFDNTSIYISGQVGTQITFSKQYDLKPAFVFGGNLGFRYAL